jgi:DNA relaxase NicK
MLDSSIISAGIDYISATMSYGEAGAIEWYSGCTRAIERIASEGNELQHSRRNGYEGLSTGGSFVGEGLQGYFCTISGERAQAGFTDVYRYNPHVSRLDVQCTVRTPMQDTSTALAARNAVALANKRLGKASQRNATLIEDLRGGATCYVCSKKSEQFARIYNKDAESGEERYKNAWRYEVQLKNNLATMTAEMFRLSEYAQPVQAAVFVRQWLRKRGVAVPWKAEAELHALPSEKNSASDVEARLRWLREQVAPSLRRLLKLGLHDSILEALGLDEYGGGERE